MPESTPTSAATDGEFRFRNVVLDRGRRELRVDGRSVEVQPKVFDLLEHLIANRDRVVDKNELLSVLWPDVVVTEASLTQALKKARRLLGDDGDRQEIIRTVQRRGFRFVAALESTAEASTPAPVPTPPAVAPDPSVAVLPFADMSPARDQQHLCDGMAEEIMNALTRIEGLRVAARTSTFQFRDGSADVREIAAKLGVSSIVEGSIRRSGSQLRVAAQLIDAATGFHRWSERWDRSVDDIFAIEDEISLRVAEALRRHLTTSERASMGVARPSEVLVYEFYLRGMGFMRAFGRRNQKSAIGMFERALAIDPDYAPAWAGLATSHSLLYMYAEATPEHLSSAATAGARAVAIDPFSADAHVALGQSAVLQKNFAAAEKSFARAEELNPRLFHAWYLHGRCCASQGKHMEAVKLYDAAWKVRPEDYEAQNLAAQSWRSLGNTEEATRAGRRSMIAAERAVALNPQDVRALALGSAFHVQAGRPEIARDWLERSVALEPDEAHVQYNAACTWVALGDFAKALDHLEQIDVAGMANRSWMEQDSSFDPIRDEPRFKALMARAG